MTLLPLSEIAEKKFKSTNSVLPPYKKKVCPFSVLVFSQANGTSPSYKPFSEALCSCARLEYHKIDVGEKLLARKLL